MDLKEIDDREQVYTTQGMLLLEMIEGIDLDHMEKWIKENMFVIGFTNIHAYLLRNSKEDSRRIAKELAGVE